MTRTLFWPFSTLPWLAILCCHSAPAATLITLASFNGSFNDPNEGYSPDSGLISDAGGNLYGTTQRGGASDRGTIFRVEAGTNALTTLASFGTGSYPIAGLISDAHGNLYGTTREGGVNDHGTVFRLAAGSNAITTLASFNRANGERPFAGLIADGGGNLYGTTRAGGATGHGTVFRLAAETNTLTTLASFNVANGSHPVAGLISDAGGNLYGTTRGGGGFDHGTIFRVEAGTNALTTLATFNGANGRAPRAGLIADAHGNLYGTTNLGGASNHGTVFRLEAGTNALTTLASFDGANGRWPVAELISDAAGNLYGTTSFGGASDSGTVFRLEAGTNALTTLISFYGVTGRSPVAELISDAAGNLYGTTGEGGPSNLGTVFRLSDAGFVVSSAIPGDFDGLNGVGPEDLAIWQAAFCQTGAADADGDGDSDGRDFLIWQRHYGPSGALTGSPQNVPEPNTALILSVTTCCFAWRKR